jgi:hypothetical protein
LVSVLRRTGKDDARANLLLAAFMLGACAEPIPLEPDAFVAMPSANRLSAQCIFEVPAPGGLGGYWLSGNSAILISEDFVSIERNTNHTLLARTCYHSEIGRIHSIAALKWRVTDETLELYDGCSGWFTIGTLNAVEDTLSLPPESFWAQRDTLVFHHANVAEIPEDARKQFEFCSEPEFY